MNATEKHKAIMRKYYIKNRESMLKYSKEYYKRNRKKMKKCYEEWKVKNREKYLNYHKDYHQKFKIKLLTHYGFGVCACVICGENRLACLSIDHIEGNGAKHRKELRKQRQSFYYWLKREEYPKGFQTLCMNCQFIKRANNNENKKAEKA